MKVKFKGFQKGDGVRGPCRIKGEIREPGAIYDVDEGLGNWMISKDLAVKIEEEIPELSIEEAPSIPLHPHEPVVSTPTAKLTAYDKLVEVVGHHLCEIYGNYGTGKSRFVHSIAVEAQLTGKKVKYVDTEGGLSDNHVKELQNYEYVGDELEDLIDAVAKAKEERSKYDLLIVDSVGHPVYVNYVEMGRMDEKLQSYQKLAAVFRDMVRFARGERGKDLGNRFGLAIAINHPVSEFSRVLKDLPAESPLDPFGGQIHRVPKLVLRSEVVEVSPEKSVYTLVTRKARTLPEGVEVVRFTIDKQGSRIEWRV